MSIRYWRLKDRYYRLVGNRCKDCRAEFFPPVYRCKECGSTHLADHAMPREGRILTHTQLHEPLPGFEGQVPLNLAVVQLKNGVRVLGQIVDTPQDKVETGAKTRVVTRRVRVDGDSGQILYGYKFVID
jgi:uncharacterized OB-fold protein